MLVRINGDEEEAHGKAVVEKAQQEDTVQSLREDQEGEQVGWCLQDTKPSQQ